MQPINTNFISRKSRYPPSFRASPALVVGVGTNPIVGITPSLLRRGSFQLSSPALAGGVVNNKFKQKRLQSVILTQRKIKLSDFRVEVVFVFKRAFLYKMP